MPVKPKVDLCDFLDDGRVKIVFGGVSRTLRRPMIGELKDFNKELVEIASAAQSKGTGVESLDIDDMVSTTLEWWKNVINSLRGEDELPAPDDTDDYPTWMMNTDLLVKIQTHWREVPWGSGGK